MVTKLDHNQIAQKEHSVEAIAKKVVLVDGTGTVYTAGEISFLVDGVPQPVDIDTATPANNTPLPTAIYTGLGGDPIDFSAGNATVSTLRVVIATDQAPLPVSQSGVWSVSATIQEYDVVQFARNDYTSTSVSTATYLEIVGSTAADVKAIDIFDSSGQTLVLAVGPAASEVDKFLITPGGVDKVPVIIPSGSRISVKAVSALADAGEISINLYG